MPNVTFYTSDTSLCSNFRKMSYKQRLCHLAKEITMHGRFGHWFLFLPLSSSLSPSLPLLPSILPVPVVSSQQAIKNLYLSETQQFGR